MLERGGMRAALANCLRHCDVFLPSGHELTLLTDAPSEDAAIDAVLKLGVSSVVVKRGARGASFHDAQGALHIAAHAVEEIDPTGAGDCFGATFVACRVQGRPPAECLRYANASGARAVGVQGPMEGTSSFAELDAFLAARS
jgi:tagatose kinase